MQNTCLIDNLGVASFLAAKGLKLLGTEPAPNKRNIVAFRFDDPERRAPGLIADYYTDAVVIARDFDEQLTRMKSLIWDRVHPEKRPYRSDSVVTPNYFSDGGVRR
jgi:hypothetical protein